MKRRADRRYRFLAAGGAAAAALMLLVQPAIGEGPIRPAAGPPPLPAVTGDPVIVAGGDIACSPPNDPVPPTDDRCQHFATAALIERIQPDAVVNVGDSQYPFGFYEQFMGRGAYNDTWGKWKSITRPVIGDNEYEGDHGEGTGYWDYYNGPGQNDGLAAERGKGWYSYDLGTWHLIALNSERQGNNETWLTQAQWDEQLAWLRADVAAHPNKCTLAYWHKPLFSTGSSYSDPKPFAEILYEAGVDVILAGHAHRYERFLPQDPDGNATPDGFHHWTIGTGGYSINPAGAYNKNLAVKGEGFGVLKMTLKAGSFDWEFVNIDGTPDARRITDQGSAQCVGEGIIPTPTAGPSVTGLAPNALAPGSRGRTVEVDGTGFTPQTTVDFGAGVTVKSLTYVSPTRMTAVVDVADGSAEGLRDVVARAGTTAGPVCAKCFAVTTGGIVVPPRSKGPGYWFTASDGGIFAFGEAKFHGSTGDIKLAKPIVGMSPTRTGDGYWLVASDGGIFSFGDAAFHGSTGDIRLVQPIVGMATTPTGNGYWLVASDGGIFAFGDAAFYGSTGAIRLAKPIIGMAPTPSGKGYWLVASDGGMFAFGDAAFHGSTGDLKLASPIVAMAATPSGDGYWLVASDGGIFAFGDGAFHGSTGDLNLARPIVGMAATASGKGYWLVASDGGVFSFGDAGFLGSTGDIALAQPIVGMARVG